MKLKLLMISYVHFVLSALQRGKNSPTKRVRLGFNAKLYLIVRPLLWRSGCGVPLHCYYFKVHSYGQG